MQELPPFSNMESFLTFKNLTSYHLIQLRLLVSTDKENNNCWIQNTLDYFLWYQF